MKLNIKETPKRGTITDDLGIADQRKSELLNFLYAIHLEIFNENTYRNLTSYYARIADYCNTIEEYTTCMHLFIFNLARHGMLRTELEDYERIKNATKN